MRTYYVVNGNGLGKQEEFDNLEKAIIRAKQKNKKAKFKWYVISGIQECNTITKVTTEWK